jgi:phosphoglycerate dehydrogenase-like enzyme
METPNSRPMPWPPAGTRHPLLAAPNVVVTPHIGGATAETLARGAQRAVAALASVLAGQVPDDVMNPQVLKGGSLQRWP